MDFQNDTLLAAQVARQAAERGLRTEAITDGDLDHGAVVPLLFAAEAGWRAPIVVLSLDLGGDLNVVRFGEAVAYAAEGAGRRVAFIASGAPIGVCQPNGSVIHYRGFIQAVNDGAGSNRTVNVIDVENYVRGVLPREVFPSWGSAGGGAGMNALRAFAVAARTFGLSQTRYPYARTCDTPSCQVYGGTAQRQSAFAAAVAARGRGSGSGLALTSCIFQESAPVIVCMRW